MLKSTNNCLLPTVARPNIVLLWCRPTGGQKFGGMDRGDHKTQGGQQLTLELYASATDGDRDSSAVCHRTARKCAGGLDCWRD